MRMPEEINRILSDRISTWLFAPTNEAAIQLAKEGVDATRIFQVGDVMYDVALHHGQRASQTKAGALTRLDLKEKHYVLATIHRAENTDHSQRLQVIVDALSQIAEQLPVIWPLHPRTKIGRASCRERVCQYG